MIQKVYLKQDFFQYPMWQSLPTLPPLVNCWLLDFLENSKIEGLDIIELANFQKVSFGVKCNTFVDLAKDDLENVWVDGAYGYVLRD